MKQADLQEYISRVTEKLTQKRTGIISEFRTKLEEKAMIYLKNKLNQ